MFDAVRLKLQAFFWEARGAVATLLARKWAKAFVLRGLVGAAALILIIVATTVILNKTSKKPPEIPEMFSVEKVPAEAFFLPEEPDFLPPALLYREQKKQWTAEDAAPFWTDPAVLSDDWQNKVEEYVDKLLESVP
ncbi:MAG: hypothetical protein LBK61_08845 [Spirochaetaceae bacterium]|nr:hypothetical protein [Spirochaetaceae bacterium]